MGAIIGMKNIVLASDDVSLSGDYWLFRDKNNIQTTGRHNSSNQTHSLSWWRWNAVGWSGTHNLSITTRWMTWSSSSPGYGIWPLHTTSHANTPKLHTLAARVTCGGSVGEVWVSWILIFPSNIWVLLLIHINIIILSIYIIYILSINLMIYSSYSLSSTWTATGCIKFDGYNIIITWKLKHALQATSKLKKKIKAISKLKKS